MRHEYAVHAGVYEDTWHDYETHKRRKIWRADVRGKRKEGVALSPTLSHGERERRGRVGWADWVRNNFFALRKY
ncbi:toxin PIN [Neisseria meningitidis]|uniref:toxin PIN n=1 Tax=Neisseria meningitidis TaxID=487 RepID=UPI000FCCB7BD|nr:toxin PIN [Neisseria meningitidis]